MISTKDIANSADSANCFVEKSRIFGTSVNEFRRWKEATISKCDISRKGSVDEEIYELVSYINSHDDFFTTSSCSGRILLCSDDPTTEKRVDNVKQNSKKGCHWFFVSHKTFDIEELTRTFRSVDCSSKYKFEPFVLHAQCRTIERARLLHTAAVESGFRNSGITFGKSGRKIIAAVRGTACLEVPLTNDKGERLVSDDYIRHIVDISHRKLTVNLQMIHLFHRNFIRILDSHLTESQQVQLPKGVYRKKGKPPKHSAVASVDCDSFDEPISLFNDNQ